MQRQSPADHILIYRSPECQIDLLGDPRTAPRRIALFRFDNDANDIRIRTFWPRLDLSLWRKQELILSLDQSAMEIQQRRRFKCDGRTHETLGLYQQRTEAGNHTIPNLQVGCASPRATQDQKLMFDQNGLGDDRAYAARPGDSKYDSDEMHQEHNQVTHTKC